MGIIKGNGEVAAYLAEPTDWEHEDCPTWPPKESSSWKVIRGLSGQLPAPTLTYTIAPTPAPTPTPSSAPCHTVYGYCSHYPLGCTCPEAKRTTLMERKEPMQVTAAGSQFVIA